MLGQPASSQTVCSPSRRTSDFSSVYSGPVLSRVLIHSGLRSMGTWLLRTSRRRSFRPAGSIRAPEEGGEAPVSLLIATVPADARRPAARAAGRLGVNGREGRSDALVVGAGDRPGGVGSAGREGLGRLAAAAFVDLGGQRGLLRDAVALGLLCTLQAHVGVRRRGVTRGGHGVGHGLAGVAVRSGHGVLSVAGHRTVARGRGGPVVALLAAQDHHYPDREA